MLRYVDTASTAGGDGTTTALTGANRAFASVAEAESAMQSASTLAESYRCNVRASTGVVDTSTLTIDGWGDQSASNYIEFFVEAANSHLGLPNAGYLIRCQSYTQAVNIFEQFVRITGFRVDFANDYARRAVYAEVYTTTSDVRIEKMLVVGNPNTANPAIQTAGGSFIFNVSNCIIFDAPTGIQIGGGGSLVARLNNNTVVDCATGIQRSAGTLVAKNNLVKGGTTRFTGTFDAASNYNATDAASATGGTNDQVTRTFTFSNEAGNDFRLGGADVGAKGLGTDLSGDTYPISDDVAFTTRSGAWDIGAHQYVAAASGVSKLAYGKLLTGFGGR